MKTACIVHAHSLIHCCADKCIKPQFFTTYQTKLAEIYFLEHPVKVKMVANHSSIQFWTNHTLFVLPTYELIGENINTPPDKTH